MTEHEEGGPTGVADRAAPGGEISIVLARGPVTQQATRLRKNELLQDLQASLATYDFLLTGDVRVDLEWLVHERLRYESDEAADVDNIVKPTLDALCGPAGLLLDDCQIQSVSSTWIDWVRDDQQLTVRVHHDPNEYISRGAIVFVDLGQNLYIPLSTEAPLDFRKSVAEFLARVVLFRRQSEDLGIDFHLARLCMPAQRVFHRSRIKNFRMCSLGDYATDKP